MSLDKFETRGMLMALAGTSLDPEDHGFQIMNGSAERLADKGERNIDTPHLGAKPFYLKNKRAAIQGMIEVTPPVQPGDATLGKVPYRVALLAAAMAETHTVAERKTVLNPVSLELAKADATFYQGGQFLEVTDGRANITGLKAEIGMPTVIEQFRLEGKYTEIEEDALPEIDLSDYPKPTVNEYHNTELMISTINGVSVDLPLKGELLKIDFGNAVESVELTGYKESDIGAKAATCTLRFARPAIGDFNPQAEVDAEHIITGYWKVSEPDGRFTKIGFRMQPEKCADVNIKKQMGYELTGPCIPSDAGNDEYYIEFGDDTFHINGDATGTEGAEGGAYSFTGYTLSGIYDNTPGVTWAVSAGALPTGCSINSSTGAITGTASADGEFTFTITATDSSSPAKVATKTDLITIN